MITDAGYVAIVKGCRELYKRHAVPSNTHFFGSILAWAWVTLQWNLVSRSNSVENIHLEHVSWHGDSMRILFAKSKGDQTGEGLSNEKHIYPNPKRPEVCAILALAVYFFSTSRPLKDGELKDTKLFPGTFQKAHWADLLQDGIKNVEDGIDLGCLKKDSKCLGLLSTFIFSSFYSLVGTHSIRKGAATFLLSLVDGPSAIMVYLRAGWSLGNVPDRYIHAGTGSDQLVGRSVALLPLHSPEFADLGPHFTQAGMKLLLTMGIDKFCPSFEKLPDTFKTSVPYLLATLCHHYTWLTSNLPSTFPLWQSQIFTRFFSDFEELRKHVTLGCNINKETNMTATGIPGHIATSTKLDELSTKVTKLTDELAESRKETRQVLADYHQQTLNVLNEQPEILKKLLLQHFDGLGPRTITIEDLTGVMKEMSKNMTTKFQEMIDNSGFSSFVRSSIQPATTISATNTITSNVDTHHAYHYWGNKYRLICDCSCTSACHTDEFVSYSFIVPSCSLNAFYRLWLFGDARNKTGPLKLLKSIYKTDIKESTNSKEISESNWNKITKAAMVIRNFEKFLPTDKVLSESNFDQIFPKAYASFYDSLYSDAKRHKDWLQISYGALCNRISKINNPSVPQITRNNRK